MDLNFTQFISYNSIIVDEIDLYEDAYGLNTEFFDVKELLTQLNPVPEISPADKLTWKVNGLN